MSATSQCPECGTQLPESAPEGLCPKCLMGAALDSDPPPENSPFAATTPQHPVFVPPSVAELAPLFPQLEVLALIGHGGMGAVYKARQQKLDRLVALKIIRPESADDPAFAERFNREARTLARLSHPHIVAVHDFGEVTTIPDAERVRDGERTMLYFFVMEYVDGANLRQLMQAAEKGSGPDCRNGPLAAAHNCVLTPLPPEQALAIVPQVCDALQYAHQEGVIHRDIKPENILVDARGRVKIADFGLAKLAANTPEQFTLTGTHQVMGTPRYMAPEQMTGSRGVDHRADIYSLGVVFYEMLTGELPMGSFELPSRKVAIDARLDDVVLKALASDPDRRFQQVSEFASRLYAIAAPAVSHLSPPGGVAQPWPGPSTILENAVGGAIQQVRGGLLRRMTLHPNAPAVLAMLMAAGIIAATVVLFIPFGLNTTNRLPGNVGEGAVAVAVTSVVLLLTLFAVGTLRHQPAGRPWAILLAGAVLLPTLGVVHNGVSRALARVEPHAGEGELWLTAVLGFTIVLLGAGAWDLRNWLNRGESSVPGSSARRSGMMALQAIASRTALTAPVARDSVTLTVKQVQEGDLPDVCMACGDATTGRVSHSFSYQSDLAGVLTFFGIVCGLFPGLIIASLTTREQRVPCPLCPQHTNHWSRFVWFASTGWLLALMCGGFGGLCGWALSLKSNEMAIPIGIAIGALVGVAAYVIPLIRMATTRISSARITEDRIELTRVSSGFARAIREQHPSGDPLPTAYPGQVSTGA